MQRRHLLGLAAAATTTGLGLPLGAAAQVGDWPKGKTITYVVPFTAGGSTDVVGRTLAEKLQVALGQTVVVDNKPGQGGGIGASFVAKAPADGYTLFGGTISTHASTPACTSTWPTTR
jgi:tripartite-type tricarboxylate transporter receptor subunit TctC